MRRMLATQRRLFIVMVVALLVVGLGAVGFADVRIVMDDDGDSDELLIKGGRVRSELGDGQWMLIDCKSDEVSIVGQGRYWRGSLTEFGQATLASTQQLLDDVDEDVDVMGLLGQLFGGSAQPEAIEVRVTKRGTDTIAGYAATEYHIETGSGSKWKTYENIWISAAFMDVLQAEVGQCLNLMFDFEESMMEVVPFMPDNVKAVLADDAYRTLLTEGYPLRTVTQVEFFGMSIETASEVSEVSRDPIPEERFVVPAAYVRVENPLEILLGD